MSFVHLHRHSDASTLDGAGTSWQFAARAAELGQSYLAQTDHGSINGALKHRKACEEHGIIPIQGVEAYWRPDRKVREKEWRYRRWHLILLATDLRGWHNLIRVTSASYVDGFYQNPCVDWELLERYHEGLICSASCILGPLSYLIENGTDGQVEEFVQRMCKIFGDRFFVEVMPHDWDRQRAMNIELVSLANRHGIGYYATVDAHYPYADWASTQKLVALIATNTTVVQAEAQNRERIARGDEVYELGHEGLHLMDEAEVRDRFARFHPDLAADVVDRALSTTLDVAHLVKPYLMDRQLKMPRVAPTPADAERIVTEWCHEGMKRIGREADADYHARLIYELGVIRDRGAMDYFVLVGDLVRWAKSDAPLPPSPDDPNPPLKKPMRIGSGRGSAAGCMVSYLCGITTIDPIAHRLSFERFLNPERSGLPDIDIDVESCAVPGYDRRLEGKEYVIRKYGRESVADVVSYSTFQPRAALKDVARILGLDGFRTKKVTDLIDPVHDSDLTKIRERIPELDAWARDFPDAWEHAVRLENGGDALVSRMSRHAGGIAIVAGHVSDHMPVVKSAEGDPGLRTGWSETPRISICDELGIPKIDWLGIAGMAQQQMALDSHQYRTGSSIDLDALPVLQDPYDVDPEVMKHFGEGHTLGVNQFEGANITQLLRQMRPENLIDVAAANALFRPGPIGSGAPWSYAKRKNGEEEYDIPEPLMATLGETYGIPAFQEQVMEIFQVLAGYTAGQADGVRKIIAKLYREKGDRAERELQALYADFAPKAKQKGLTEDQVEAVWGQILPFAGYSFNRSHAMGYSVQAYQDMWQKVYISLDFYAALLTIEPDKVFAAVRESRVFGVTLLPPDINVSEGSFTVDVDAEALRFGVRGIKGVGDAVVEQLIADRPFSSIEDFNKRSARKYSKVNKGAREKLIRAGALDSFGARADWQPADRASAELELLGVALEPGGLLGDDAALVREHTYTEQEISEAASGDRIIIGGKIGDLRTTRVKRGRQQGREMAFMTVSLDLESARLTCFPSIWDAFKDLIRSDEMVIVSGTKDDRGSVIVSEMMPLARFVEELRQESIAA